MKIAHVITTIERGGAEKALLALATALAGANHQVTIFPLKGRAELLDDFKNVGASVNLTLLNKPFLYQILKSSALFESFDIIHQHLPRAEILGKLSGTRIPRVTTRHNSEHFAQKILLPASSHLSRWVTRDVKVVIAISAAVRLFLKEHKEIHGKPRVEIVYYGYQFKSLSESNNQEKPEPSNALKLGTVSRLVKQKNLSFLLCAISQLIAEGLNVEVSIVGEGPLDSKLRKEVRRLHLSNVVSFLPKRNDIVDYISNLDVFALTSTYEGFGLVLLEAINAGTPIIASNNTSIPEVLGSSHPGLFETNNVLQFKLLVKYAARDSSFRLSCLEHQNDRLVIFSQERNLMAHMNIYRWILA